MKKTAAPEKPVELFEPLTQVYRTRMTCQQAATAIPKKSHPPTQHIAPYRLTGAPYEAWLLDSGASATFMATSSLNACGAWVADMKHEQFRAANGSKVDIDGTTTLTIWVGFHTGRDKNWMPEHKSAKLKCLVGGISQSSSWCIWYRGTLVSLTD